MNKVQVCTLCESCIKVCEPGALFINEAGIIQLKKELCNHCSECAEVCPPKVIWFDEENYPVICDLCGGTPQCVRWCKYDAIVVK